MNKKELRDWIDSFADDIAFVYKGKNGLVMPLSRDKNITLCYGDNEVVLRTANEVMNYPLFDGKSLNDICEIVEFE